MSSTMAIVIAAVVVLAVIALALLVAAALRDRRSRQLRTRFGPEYERAMEETGDRKQAERILEDRVRRRQELPVRELEPPARQRYAEEWRAVQIRFVDDPRAAVAAADELVTRVMRDSGYPAEDFEQQVADVSVDHARSAEAYRRGHAVLGDARESVATDDLRQAMVHYRELFADLVGEPAVANAGAARPAPDAAADDVPAPGTRKEVG